MGQVSEMAKLVGEKQINVRERGVHCRVGDKISPLKKRYATRIRWRQLCAVRFMKKLEQTENRDNFFDDGAKFFISTRLWLRKTRGQGRSGLGWAGGIQNRTKDAAKDFLNELPRREWKLIRLGINFWRDKGEISSNGERGRKGLKEKARAKPKALLWKNESHSILSRGDADRFLILRYINGEGVFIRSIVHLFSTIFNCTLERIIIVSTNISRYIFQHCWIKISKVIFNIRYN